MIDIKSNGWDDDAISRCFHLALLSYDYDYDDGHGHGHGHGRPEEGKDDKNQNQFTFEPRPNLIMDENGHACRIHEEDNVLEMNAAASAVMGIDNRDHDHDHAGGGAQSIEPGANAHRHASKDQDNRLSLCGDLPLPTWALGDAYANANAPLDP